MPATARLAAAPNTVRSGTHFFLTTFYRCDLLSANGDAQRCHARLTNQNDKPLAEQITLQHRVMLRHDGDHNGWVRCQGRQSHR